MNLLADLGSGDKAELPKGTVPIGEAILKCNPVLEGFGNAKTSRNDNSSRFGKYTLMYFGLSEEAIYGARVQNYLLEKSRVVSVTNQERGYHIFYFLLRGGPKDLLKTLGLVDKKGDRMSPFDFNFLKQTCDKALWGDLPEKHDVDGYNEVQDTFTTLKFTEVE
jgi:myosin heavy subunit